jgi:tRNA-2-methylthio-N6-dimethylallyladenosine synthase
MKYHIVTFGCQQNEADSERIASMLEARGMAATDDIKKADHIVINTCMIREMAENRVYGLVNNINKLKTKSQNSKSYNPKIVVTGCMVGMAMRDKTGKFLKLIRSRLPGVDEFLPIEEVGFDHAPLRTNTKHAWVPISNGCNNFCTFCVVPFTRGREISRPYEDILKECKNLAEKGFKEITLLGMNVNSYGADLIVGAENIQVMRDIEKTYFVNQKNEIRNTKQSRKTNDQNTKQFEHSNLENADLFRASKLEFRNSEKKPVYVKHLGRYRIPTLFPYLLEEVGKIKGIELVNFMSSNPWDFSDELIDVIVRNPNISRQLHFAVQSGSDTVLKRMNRWYTAKQFLALIVKLKNKIPDLKISTDIIVGFCGETDEEFQETVDMVKKVGFSKAYVAIYSDRPMTASHKAYKDDVPFPVKKKRWQILEKLINTPNLKKRNKKIN